MHRGLEEDSSKFKCMIRVDSDHALANQDCYEFLGGGQG